MCIDECKRGVFKVKFNSNRPFVACHSRESCFYFELAQVFNTSTVNFLSKHDDFLTNHGFVDNRNVVWAKAVLEHLLPKKSSILIFSNDHHFLGVEWHHFLQPYHVDVRWYYTMFQQDFFHVEYRWIRWVSSAVPGQHWDLQVTLSGVNLLMPLHFKF